MRNLNLIILLASALLIAAFMNSCNQETQIFNDTATSEISHMKSFKEDVNNLITKMDLIQSAIDEVQNSEIICSDPNIGNCVGPFLHTTTVIYRGCPFTVTGEVYFCPNLETGGTYISIGNITGITYDWFYNPDCTTILYEWVGLWLNQQTEALNDSIDTWQYAIERDWESHFVTQFILNSTSQSYFCDQPQIDANVLIENYRGTCYQRCINYSEKGGLIWQDLRCGYGCCKRSTKYCVNRTTGKLESNTTVQVIRNCNYDPEPYPGCQYLSECKQTCSKIR